MQNIVPYKRGYMEERNNKNKEIIYIYSCIFMGVIALFNGESNSICDQGYQPRQA